MKRVVLTPEQVEALETSDDMMTAVSPEGRFIGLFQPAKPPFMPHFDEAELRAELASGVKGRALDDIIRDAKVKYGIHG